LKVENSSYINLKHKKVVFPFGEFYFFENFIIGELYDGIHFDFINALIVIEEIYKYYQKDFKIVYIANRINSYSTDPQTWTNLQKEVGVDFLIAAALIVYNDISFKVAAVEKQISKTYLKRCVSLDEAINWALNIVELKRRK